MQKITSFLIILISVSLTVKGQTGAATTEKQSLKWFTDARFGMFIHWDMSSIAGTEISWSRKGSKPLDIFGDPAGYVEDPIYDHLYEKFNPTSFDATAWVNLAKAAGMKYIVFTAKHHGGFCMWDTKFTDYSIMHTPYGKDVIKQLADACHKAGIKFGIYYSPRDWHNPQYGIGDNKDYVSYMNGQVKELLTNYGKVDIIWWDSYGKGDLVNFWKIGETFDLVKKLQPGIVMNNRLAVLGDYNKQPPPYVGEWDTPEQNIGSFQNTRPWESCMSIVATPDGGGWSYRPDGKIRSYEECIKGLINCATGDGNLLLDVGPDATGIIPADQANRLTEMGEWLKKYGESIYNTKGGPYKNDQWGGATFKGNKVYLHIAKWNGNQLRLPALKAKILKCGNLTNPMNKPAFTQDGKYLTITLPPGQQDNIDTIITLELGDSAWKEMIGGSPIVVL